jgi:hypothetical protein
MKKEERSEFHQQKTHCMTWGDNHKFYRKNLDYLKLLAYEKAFYFSDVKIDGKPITRSF